MKTILLALLALTGTPSFAAFISVDLLPRFSYEGLDLGCVLSNTLGPRKIILTGKIKGKTLSEAKLSNNSADPAYGSGIGESIRFSDAELKGIEVEADSLGEYHVLTLPLSARLLNWIFFSIDTLPGIMACRPVLSLATLGPWGTTYKFAQGTSSDYLSPVQRFHGVLGRPMYVPGPLTTTPRPSPYEGTPYTIKFGMVQRQSNM